MPADDPKSARGSLRIAKPKQLIFPLVVCTLSACSGWKASQGGEYLLAQAMLWLTASTLLFGRIARIPLNSTPRGAIRSSLWLLLALLIASTGSRQTLSVPWLLSTPLLCFAIGIVQYCFGSKAVPPVLAPLLVLVIAVPQLPLLLEAASLPLRMISTQLSGLLLTFTGIPTETFGTELWLGKERIAVTSACSGISSLESLLWLGWIIVIRQQPPGLPRLSTYSFLIPLVIAGNTLRISLLVLATRIFGPEILSSPLHMQTGWLTAALTFLAFIGLSSFVTPIFQKPRAIANLDAGRTSSQRQTKVGFDPTPAQSEISSSGQ